MYFSKNMEKIKCLCSTLRMVERMKWDKTSVLKHLLMKCALLQLPLAFANDKQILC